MSKKRKKKGLQATETSKAESAPEQESAVEEPAKAVVPVEPPPGKLGTIVPWVIFALCTLLFAVKPVVSPPKVKEGFDYHAFGKLPVLLGGRIKPMDTVARTSLLQHLLALSHRYQLARLQLWCEQPIWDAVMSQLLPSSPVHL